MFEPELLNTPQELLAYPYLWKPTKITAFLKASWNIVKDGGHPDFVQNLSANSSKVFASCTHSSWVEILGQEHWNILKCDGKGKIRQKLSSAQSKCVVELLRLIRNKYEHCLEYEDVQKNVLNWFNVDGELVDEKFITFWTNKFPLLVPFLWISFQKFRNHSTLKEYYWFLYSSTNLWKPDKSLRFLQQCYKIVKNPRHRKFTINLSTLSYRAFSFNEPVWIRVIGKTHWNILKCDSNGIVRHKPNGFQSKSVIELLKLLWDKYEHGHEYKPEDKTILGWFNQRGDLDEAQFITYWNHKFPLMLPFLWTSFHEFKHHSSLKEFYCGWTNEPDLMPLMKDLDDYAKQLDKSLHENLEQGELLRRFTYQPSGQLSKCIVEFRAIDRVEKILDGYSAISLFSNPRKGCLIATHYSKITALHCTLKYSGLSPTAQPLQLIFVDDILDDIIGKISQESSSRLIIFGDEKTMSYEKITDALGKLKKVSGLNEIFESPVCWKDLSRLKRKLLFKHGRVIIQGKVEKIKSLFRGYKTQDNLKGISGECLNRLLKYHKVSLFGKYQLPELDQLYLERVIYIDGCVKTHVLSSMYRKNSLIDYNYNDRKPRDILIITNTTREKITELIGRENIIEVETIEELEIVWNCNYYLVRKDFDHSFGMLTALDLKFYLRIFHARFVNETDLFLWVYRDNEFEVGTDIWPDIFVEWREQDFVEKVIRERKDAIFFIGEPGWGKSELLISLGRRFRKGVVINLSMSTFADEIRKVIGNEDCTTAAVKKVIQQVLCCDSDTERHVISNLMVQQQRAYGFKRVELMLDGLDEVPKQNRSLALKVLTLIQSELVGVRLWITSREPFPDDLRKFRYVSCKIAEFHVYDQQTFFRTFWWQKNIFSISEEDLCDLACEFVSTLSWGIKNNLQTCITMSPLNCRLLAELYEDKLNQMLSSVKTGNRFAELPLSSALMYEALIEKKIVVYIREKEKITGKANSLVVREAREQFLEKHMLLAVYLLIPEKLYANKNDEIQDLEESGLEKMGILVPSKGEWPLFVHRTYAEYLVARFIVKVLKSGKVSICDSFEAYHKLIIYVLYYRVEDSFSFPVICMFLNEMLDLSDTEYQNIILQWRNKNGRHKPKFEANLDISDYLRILFRFEYFNISKLILDMWIHDENDSFYSNILQIAIHNEVPLNYFIRLCKMFDYELKGMYIENSHDFDIFQTALKCGNFEISQYLIEEWFPPKTWQLIPQIRKGGGGIMHIILEYNSQCFNTFDRESEKDKIKLMKLIHEMDASVIEIKDKKGRTPLMSIGLIDYTGYCYWLRNFMVEELGAYDSGERHEDSNVLDTNMGRNIIARLFIYCNARVRTMWRNLLR